MIVDPSKCVDTFMVVIEMYNMKGDFSRSAKYMEEVAAIKEAVSLIFQGLLLYTFSILFPIEWCIRQICS
jgi:hypothetical protein